ncbi:MAG TPA: hypothetical protein VJH97_03600 [Candidatus Nanoarchaeia archaeon]|nr:hypothetical protein [Candidatus Nanoarchaeia archaeon]
MVNIEKVEENGLLALIVHGDSYDEGLNFPTLPTLPFQLGLHNQKKGSVVEAHQHHMIKAGNIVSTEVFYIKKGKVKVSIYNQKKQKVKDIIASAGDIVYLLSGHALEYLEDTIMFEVKQGPYRSRMDDKVMIK